MARNIVKTLMSPDGNTRVDILEREDGYFGFVELKRYDGHPDVGEYWALFHASKTVAETAEIAEREARARVDWLVQNSN